MKVTNTLDVAAQLYAATPLHLLEGSECSGFAPDADKGSHGGEVPTATKTAVTELLDLLNGCLEDQHGAQVEAEAICRKYDGMAVPAGLETAAAWDLFYRAVEVRADEKITSFIRRQNSHLFETPSLIAGIEKDFQVGPACPLAGADVLVCQHLMASSVPELKAIRRLIPDLRFIEVLGKPYSANRLALLELAESGFPVNLASCEMPALDDYPFASFAQRHRRIAADCVRRYVAEHAESSRPLLVLDDGGALINAVGQEVMAGNIRRPVVAIEQTTHGLYAIDRKFFNRSGSSGFAVISVATSLAKLGYESALIADSVLKESAAWLDLLERRGHRPQIDAELRTGIVGFGVIGAAVARQLSQNDKAVTVFDRNRHKIALARSDRVEMAWSLRNLLQSSNVVIGASGGAAMDEIAADSLRDGTVLISASSGDKEFRGIGDWDLELEPVLPQAGTNKFDHAHGLVRARKGKRTVYIVNRGFPVNFDGSHDPIPLDRIQLTRALMVGAVLQAGGIEAVGQESLVGLSGDFQYNEFLDRFLATQIAGHGLGRL